MLHTTKCKKYKLNQNQIQFKQRMKMKLLFQESSKIMLLNQY